MLNTAKLLHVIHSCGHAENIKVAPNVRAAFVREIRVEAKAQLCQVCTRVATRKASQKK